MKKQTEAKGKIWLSHNISKYRPSVWALTVMTVFATVCSVGFAYLSGSLLNSAVDNNRQKLVFFACIVLGLLVLRIFLRACTNYLAEKCRSTIVTDLRNKLFKKILKSDYSSVKDYHSGDVITRITADTAEVAGTTVGILPQAVGMIIQIIGVLIALFLIDALLALFLIVGGSLLIGISAFFRKKTKRYYKDIVSADGQSRSFMQESVISSLTIKAFGAEEKTAKKAEMVLDLYKNCRIDRAKLASFIGILYSIVTNLGLVFAILWCVFGVMDGMAYGSILSTVLLMEQLQRPLNSISSIMPAYYSRQASAERLCEIESLEEEPILPETPIDYAKISSLNVENVEFSYDKDLVLDGVSLCFKKGEITCIHGVSGGGKSTLFKLLLGAYKPEKGSVNIDYEGEKIEIDSTCRDLFAYVPQGNFLFTGSIYENLTFFASEQDKNLLEERVKIAIEDACAEFVYDLPNGLQTLLTEQGGGLSEGQKQRLAVARAFISNRPILLLDEATSALDEETEKRLIDNLRKMDDKTVIIISHRQAVIENAESCIKM